MQVRNAVGLAECSLFRVHKAGIKMLRDLCSSLEALMMNLLSSSLRLLAEFITCGCRSDISVSSWVIGQGPLQLLEITYVPWFMALLSSMLATPQILLVFRISLTSLLQAGEILHFKNLCYQIGPIQIIQDNLSISRSHLLYVITNSGDQHMDIFQRQLFHLSHLSFFRVQLFHLR